MMTRKTIVTLVLSCICLVLLGLTDAQGQTPSPKKPRTKTAKKEPTEKVMKMAEGVEISKAKYIFVVNPIDTIAELVLLKDGSTTVAYIITESIRCVYSITETQRDDMGKSFLSAGDSFITSRRILDSKSNKDITADVLTRRSDNSIRLSSPNYQIIQMDSTVN